MNEPYGNTLFNARIRPLFLGTAWLEERKRRRRGNLHVWGGRVSMLSLRGGPFCKEGEGGETERFQKICNAKSKKERRFRKAHGRNDFAISQQNRRARRRGGEGEKY